jgi:isopenicillin-N N-acyltransferase like protein
MIPVHVSRESTPAEQGLALGATFRPAIERTFASYLELFAVHGLGAARVRELGERALYETEAWAPRLAEEAAGVAAGAGLEPWQLGVLNGRTEILAAAAVTGEGECSTSVVLDEIAPRTVQTWDWHDTLRHVMLLRAIEVRPSFGVCTFTEFGIAGKIGVNSAGLGVHFNVLRHRSDNAHIGVPVHVVARRILDEASTVDDATSLARSARLSASSVLTVVTRNEVRGLELSPAGVAELTGANLVHTNHFLDPALAPGERTDPSESTTRERLAALAARADTLRSPDRDQRAAALRSHRADGAALCAHADLSLPPHMRWESLATISLDVVEGRLDVHEGGPCGVAPDTWQSLSAKEIA